jgi:general secretion pathway protein G
MKQLTRRRAVQHAFTLIELLVVIVILAILATVVITKVTSKVDDAKETKAMADIKAMADAVEMFKLDHGVYPSSLAALVSNVDNVPNWNKAYLSTLPNDLKGEGKAFDPWGKEYVYTVPGSGNKDFEISTVTDKGTPVTNTN